MSAGYESFLNGVIAHMCYCCQRLLVTKMYQHIFIFLFSQDQEIDEEIELIVLASDGLWDVVPNDVSPALSFSLSLSLSLSLWHTTHRGHMHLHVHAHTHFID